VIAFEQNLAYIYDRLVCTIDPYTGISKEFGNFSGLVCVSSERFFHVTGVLLLQSTDDHHQAGLKVNTIYKRILDELVHCSVVALYIVTSSKVSGFLDFEEELPHIC
jgi:hypothetical protein